MNQLFERILADIKEIQLRDELTEEEAIKLADAMDSISSVWEKSMDRRLKAVN